MPEFLACLTFCVYNAWPFPKIHKVVIFFIVGNNFQSLDNNILKTVVSETYVSMFFLLLFLKEIKALVHLLKPGLILKSLPKCIDLLCNFQLHLLISRCFTFSIKWINRACLLFNSAKHVMSSVLNIRPTSSWPFLITMNLTQYTMYAAGFHDWL